MGPSSMLGEIGQESTGPAGLAQPPDAVLAPALLTKFRTQVKVRRDCGMQAQCKRRCTWSSGAWSVGCSRGWPGASFEL